MMSPKQRRRLVELHKHEPSYAAITVLRCAACLLTVGGLVVIGTAPDARDEALAQPQHLNDGVARSAAVQYVHPVGYSTDDSASGGETSTAASHNADTRIGQR